MMIVDPFVQKQLERYIDEIENGEFEHIYESIPVRQADLTGQLTDLLLKVDANPLEHLPYIPSNYLYGSGRTHLVIPDNIKYINDNAFFRSSLESIVIPTSVENIGQGVFAYSPRLRSIDLSQVSLQVLSYALCQNCASLVEFKLPRNCTFIESGVFWGCHKLEELEIDQSVNYVMNQMVFRVQWTNNNHDDTAIKCTDGIVLVDHYGNKQVKE